MAHEKSGMEAEFDALVAVVTGAAQGIGRAIAEELHQRGATLVLVDRNAAGLVATVQDLSSPGLAQVHSAIADLADPAAITALAAQIATLTPHVNILVNNAGIEYDLPFDQVTAELFDRVIAINLRAPFLMSQSLAPLFPAAGGAIVNIGSIHATHAFLNAIPYACSKAGMMALTRNLALELASKRIRVNAVCPGYIDTALWDEWVKSSPDPEALAAQTEALHPLGRRGLPADVASAVAYLASPASAWITGTHLVIDGGLTIRAHP